MGIMYISTMSTPSVPVTFHSARLREQRESLELSRADVVKQLYALGLDVSPSTIENWENGDTTPTAIQLPALAYVLKMSLADCYEVVDKTSKFPTSFFAHTRT